MKSSRGDLKKNVKIGFSTAGFTGMMLDASLDPLEYNIAVPRKVVELAHRPSSLYACRGGGAFCG
ncbi:hypothetical protein ES703_12399 [subsurface metagenome]